jgi:hypothetical protein
MTMSHVAARQELRGLLAELNLPPVAPLNATNGAA